MKDHNFYCLGCQKVHVRKVPVSQIKDFQEIIKKQHGAMVMIPCEACLSKLSAKEKAA